jgi:hypothetical protein
MYSVHSFAAFLFDFVWFLKELFCSAPTMGADANDVRPSLASTNESPGHGPGLSCASISGSALRSTQTHIPSHKAGDETLEYDGARSSVHGAMISQNELGVKGSNEH